MPTSFPMPRTLAGNRLTPSPVLCEHCRGPLPSGPGRGEPRRFCSSRCRRLGWLDRQCAMGAADHRAALETVAFRLAGIIGRLQRRTSLAELAVSLGLRGEDRAGMLAAYVDESGTHAGSPSVVLAVCVSPVDQWIRFEREWAELLAEHGLSFFHMTDCKNGRGEYIGWDQERKRRAIRRAMSIVGLRTHLRLALGVNLADFEEHTRFGDNISPYTYCSIEMAKHVGEWMRRYHPTDRVSYVFESGTGWGGQITDVLNMMRPSARPGTVSVSVSVRTPLTTSAGYCRSRRLMFSPTSAGKSP